jgi:DnaJ family protein C protein 25
MQLLFTVFLLLASVALAKKPIFDPLFVFCGEDDCYDLLGVNRNDNVTTISKAFRQLSKTVHPDKVHPDKRENVTEQFRLISKAYDVLKGNESRPNFDFYLDHPRSYFKATGKHAWRALPKAHPVFVLLLSMLVFSGFLHYIQVRKHQRAASILKDQIKAGLDIAKGGTDLSADLHNKAVRIYESHCKESGKKLPGSPFVSPAARDIMNNDENFDKICSTVLGDVKDWGEYAAPNWPADLFIIKVFTEYPFSFISGISTYYRRYLSGAPLSEEDKYALARDLIGADVWSDLSDAKKKEAIDAKLYESEHYDKWLLKKEGAQGELSKRQQKLQKKAQRLGRVGDAAGMPPRDLTE